MNRKIIIIITIISAHSNMLCAATACAFSVQWSFIKFLQSLLSLILNALLIIISPPYCKDNYIKCALQWLHSVNLIPLINNAAER